MSATLLGITRCDALSRCVTNAKIMIFHPHNICVRGKNLQDIVPQVAAVSRVGDSGNLRQVVTSIRAPNRPSELTRAVTDVTSHRVRVTVC